jgi:hypothetical protein
MDQFDDPYFSVCGSVEFPDSLNGFLAQQLGNTVPS